VAVNDAAGARAKPRSFGHKEARNDTKEIQSGWFDFCVILRLFVAKKSVAWVVTSTLARSGFAATR
jgi:hypothetical protein